MLNPPLFCADDVRAGPDFAARCKGGLTHAAICRTYFASDPAVNSLLDGDRGWDGAKVVEARGTLQASDVARTIWGDPYTVADLQTLVVAGIAHDGSGDNGPLQIDHYWAADTDAVRYKQSHAVSDSA